MHETKKAQLQEAEALRARLAELRAGRQRTRWPDDIRRRASAMREAWPAAKLAKALGVHRSTLHHWTKGYKSRPTLHSHTPQVFQVVSEEVSEVPVSKMMPLVLTIGGMRISISPAT